MKNKIIVGLDIGTTKIAVIVAEKNRNGLLKIHAYATEPSYGVVQGDVQNIETTTAAIKAAVEKVQLLWGHPIKEVYVGIAGRHIDSTQVTIQKRRSGNGGVSKQEIQDMEEEAYHNPVPAGKMVIHVIPQDFYADEFSDPILRPIGTACDVITGNFLIVTAKERAIKNIVDCVRGAGLEMKGEPILEPLASAAAVLEETMCQAGVVLVDIGGGTTDIAIYKNNMLKHTAVIPLAGNSINSDIETGCKILPQYAVQLKEEYGSALVNDRENLIIKIPAVSGIPEKSIQLSTLSCIISERMKEILKYVEYEIEASGVKDSLLSGVVLTGGGANLQNVRSLTEMMLAKSTGIGLPNIHLDNNSEEALKHNVSNPIYATVIGLALLGFEREEAVQPIPEPIPDPIPEQIPDGPIPEPEVDTKKEKTKKPSIFHFTWIKEAINKIAEMSDIN
jgi:cell division protein FtsA